MMKTLVSLGAALFTVALSAQVSPTVSYTVGIWPVASFTGSPVSTATYPVSEVRCGQPKLPASPLPILNPVEGRFDDPANGALDCVIDITKQVAGLAPATGLRAAFRADGATGSIQSVWSVDRPFRAAAGSAQLPIQRETAVRWWKRLLGWFFGWLRR